MGMKNVGSRASARRLKLAAVLCSTSLSLLVFPSARAVTDKWPKPPFDHPLPQPTPTPTPSANPPIPTDVSASPKSQSLVAGTGGASTMSLVTPTAIGRTPGTYAVSQTGAATYTIPLWVTPGALGIQPNLAITYNSQSGDGLLGPGFSLSGLSAISRCAKTWAQDGAPGAITLTASDRFCLDGNRLRSVSGT
jgi:hypothetical protein